MSVVAEDTVAAVNQTGRPRALLVHSSDEWYGADRIVAEAVEVLSELCRVEVWLPEDARDCSGLLSARLREDGISVQYRALPILRRKLLTPRGMVSLVSSAFRTWRALRSERFDLVYLATSACAPLAPLARTRRGTRVILHVQEQWHGAERLGLRMFAAACTRILVISQAVLSSTGLRRTSRIDLLPNAVPDRGVGPEIGTATRLRPRYLMASRWAEGKGHGTLLRAWDRASCPGELVILGGPPPLGQPIDVPGLVRELVSRPETVSLVGEVTDITAQLREADAVVFPSDAPEGFGLVVIEGFAAGRPAIASRTGGPEEVITEGTSGWLFSPGDSDELAGIFARLSLPELADAGCRARADYQRLHTVDRLRRRLGAIISSELALAPRSVSA